MKERSFQTEFGKWLKIHAKEVGSAAFELKSTKGSSLPFSDVQPHQIDALWNAKHKQIYFKIPDVGFQNPFDCFLLDEARAFVVIRYGSGHWYAIDVDDFVVTQKTSDRKSLTEDVAKLLSSFSN